MSFWFLVGVVSLAVFGLAASAAVLFTRTVIRIVSRYVVRANPHIRANTLFLLRIFPLAVAVFASVGLALPAFLRFEPHLVSETVSLKLWLLAAGGGVVLTAIFARTARMLRATWKTERIWLDTAEKLQGSAWAWPVPIFRVHGIPSLLIVTGFFRPKVFISSAVLEILSPGEVSAALAHEMAHVRVFDNFKQMLFRICRLPRWLELETESAAWAAACEIAADDAALDLGASVLDLAGALVKMANLKCELSVAVAACQLLADRQCSSLQERIVHLETAIENPERPIRTHGKSRSLLILALLALPLLLSLPYANSLLNAVHEMLELLVR